MSNVTDFRTKVKIELAKINKSQRWLADQIGYTETYLSDVLCGTQKSETAKKKIAEALGNQEVILCMAV